MRILGVDLPRAADGATAVESTIVLLGDSGRVAHTERAPSLPAVASVVARLVADEPFVLGVNIPIVVPVPRAGRARAVDNLIRRRLSFRLPAGGRGAASGDRGVSGEALIAGLAAAGQACLPYPDRDRRRPGLAETHPGLILKTLLWETSALATSGDRTDRETLFRGYAAPSYRAADVRARVTWSERASRIDMLVRCLGSLDGFDLAAVTDALSGAGSDEQVEAVSGLLDATLIAGCVRRYLDRPESCLFLGDHESGYVILPADPLVRRLALSGTSQPRARLFPRESLRERLGAGARVRASDLLSVPGRPQRIEASFAEPPQYEFDNLDEMLWWKHCRHLAGPSLPTDGLRELVVVLQADEPLDGADSLKLLRSRHRTTSFRFDPPAAWRLYVPTRDGRTYPFRVLRAVYETAPEPE